MSSRWIALTTLAVALLIGVGVWAAWPEPEPEPEPEPADTGMSEERTIRLMEEIGYLQQEDR